MTMDDDKCLVPDIRIDQYEGHATITRPGSDSIALWLQDAASLRTIVMKYALQVERARPLGLPVSEYAAQSFISFAKHSAHRCFEEGIDDEYDVLQQAIGLITAEMAKAVKLRNEPLCVEITDNSGEYLPWEWLGDLDRADDYIGEALSTLGFAAIVYRREVRQEARRNGEMAAGYLNAEPRLPVRFFCNPELDGTRVEGRFFKHNDYVDLLGPLPEKSLDGQLDLAEQLVDPRRARPDGPDQVVHMSCHHEVKGNLKTASAFSLPQSESLLRFGKEDEPNLEISLTDLRHDLATAKRRSQVTEERPLIFFNACRGNFYPFTTESAVRVLLRNGNRAMISTAVKVPDNAAAEMGRSFYLRLLEGGCTAPEALLYAKWALLHSRACPLGLLYSYYGIPGLRILPVRCVPGENPIVTIWNGDSL